MSIRDLPGLLKAAHLVLARGPLYEVLDSVRRKRVKEVRPWRKERNGKT